MSCGAFGRGETGRSRPQCTDLTGGLAPTAPTGSPGSASTRSARHAGTRRACRQRSRRNGDGPDRGEVGLIRRTAQWLREHPDQARSAGLARDVDAQALAALLDILAVELVHLDTGIRRQIVESCGIALAHRMTDSPRRSGGGRFANFPFGLRGSGCRAGVPR
jgi:hypothetical protein